MNKLSKIFLIIIVLLAIALGIMTYYYFYMREGYLSAAIEMERTIKAINEKGLQIESTDNETIRIVDKME